ncbi:PqiB family protein [Geomonas anaerohicana]|uniref:MCE family protein n=1 Tax=Geomonas anaerohicana TaxID=2798583 RepID=A0ABS0YFX2_9BACT|nr:MlaD family protein [Geomonas anaerohicana]MBJ6751226.1 MCE family protein [Geomonas anaerohicana]
MTDRQDDMQDVPEAVSEPRRRFSVQLVWIIPIVAAIIGLSIAAKAWIDRGEIITISFKTGEGLEAGKTKLKYKDVMIGEVKSIAISNDRSHVVVTAEVSKDAKGLMVKDTRFWVVRARISGGNVTGLTTLLGGSYIGVEAGASTEARDQFVGLESPPAVSVDVPGRQFVLHTDDVGSLYTGSPVFFRRMQVGQVVSTDLDSDGKGVSVRVFIRAPYDRFVTTNTFFWHASGVDLTVSPGGVKLNTESMLAVLLGGISFEQRPDAPDTQAAPANTAYTLYDTHDEALKNSAVSEKFALRFRESVRGLAVGAPVDLRGVTVGEVSNIDVALDRSRSDFSVTVEIQFYPEHLLSHLHQGGAGGAPTVGGGQTRKLLDDLVAHGFRAQIKSGSLLTGQLYVALDFVPGARPAKIDWSAAPPRFPTVPGSMEKLQKNLTEIVQKIERLPLEKLAGDAGHTMRSLDDTLKSADQLLKNMDRSLVPEAKSVLSDARTTLEDVRKTLTEARGTLGGASQVLSADAPVQVDLRDTMREVSRAAQSLRVLGDYLEQHPEALIRGKKEEK